MKKLFITLFLTIIASLTFAITITNQGAWLESAYLEWTGTTASYSVSYTGTMSGTVDAELIRYYSNAGKYRVDILGLKAGTYNFTITGAGDTKTAAGIVVKAHDRSGFAFATNSPAGTASGAYNDDGTLKSDAQVLYITSSNCATVTLTVKTSSSKTTNCVGLGEILAARKKGYDTTPLCFRFIGQITKAQMNASSGALGSDDKLQMKFKEGVLSNVTVEGVGNDASFNAFGILVSACVNLEIRNLAFMNQADDGIEVNQGNPKNIWVHNCDFFYGANGGGDKDKGDGSLDSKSSSFCTFSYNHFWDSGKCNLLGNGSETRGYYSYHHNYYDHSDSRHPRVRTHDVHVYNNYFNGISKYGVGAAGKSGSCANIFAESNYFHNSKKPFLISKQGSDIAGGSTGTFSSEPGGIIKGYANVFAGTSNTPVPYSQASVEFDYYDAASRTTVVPSSVSAKQGGWTYNNFDTDASKMGTAVYPCSLDDATTAKANVIQWSGRCQNGDLQFAFTSSDDSHYDRVTGIATVLAGYTPNGNTQVYGSDGQPVQLEENPSLVLTSGEANQSGSAGTAISNIVYTASGTATSVYASGLPLGVEGVADGFALTISGTPTYGGTYNYSVIALNASGGTATLSGILTISGTPAPVPTLALISGNNAQTITLGSAITPVVYTAGGTATGISVSGLPAGVSPTIDGLTATINGTPSTTGTFNYVVSTVGGDAGTTTLNGSVKVNPDSQGGDGEGNCFEGWIENLFTSGDVTNCGTNQPSNNSNAGSVTVNDVAGTKSLKMDSNGKICFETESDGLTISIVTTSRASGAKLKVDGTNYTIPVEQSLVEITNFPAGLHTIEKGDKEPYVWYISLTGCVSGSPKQDGCGMVSINDYLVGEEASTPLLFSDCQGTDNVSLHYYGVESTTYSSVNAPAEVGEYMLVATFAANIFYYEATDTAYFEVTTPEPSDYEILPPTFLDAVEETQSSFKATWNTVENAVSYDVRVCGVFENFSNVWDFTGDWTIDANDADANLILDTAAGTNQYQRFNYADARTNQALFFADEATPIPDVAGLKFTAGAGTKLRLGFGTGMVYLNGSNLKVHIPCNVGDVVKVNAISSSKDIAAAIQRGFSVIGGNLNINNSNGITSGGLFTDTLEAVFSYIANANELVINTVSGGVNIFKITVGGETQDICETFVGVTDTFLFVNAINGNPLQTNTTYTFRVRAIDDEDNTSYWSETATAITTDIIKEEGCGTVAMSNWTYGETAANPVPASTCQGISNVSYLYSGRNTTTYESSSAKPVNAGDYTVTAIFAANSNYYQHSATANFSILKATPAATHFVCDAGEVLYDGNPKHANVILASAYSGIGTITVLYNGSPAEPSAEGIYEISCTTTEGNNFLALVTPVVLPCALNISADAPLGVPQNVAHSEVGEHGFRLDWTAVQSAENYVVELRKGEDYPEGSIVWDFAAENWTSIDVNTNDANLAADGDPVTRWDVVPVLNNEAVVFANSTPIPELDGLKFTVAQTKKMRLDFTTGRIQFTGASRSVHIPTNVGDVVYFVGKSGSSTASDRGFSVTSGGNLNAELSSPEIDATGVLTDGTIEATWVVNATSTSVVMTTIVNSMNVHRIIVVPASSAKAVRVAEYRYDTVTENSIVYDDLLANTKYYYKVKAITDTKESDWSAEGNVKTATAGADTKDLFENKLVIYPNPCSDYIVIDGNKVVGDGKKSLVEIFDINGKKLSTISYDILQSSTKISVADLKSGYYFLKIGNEVVKFVKK
ncbi:hypothetical protein FACS1894178_3930 [Bacteroidia bacterium]|nr:hypothetical protein FACS1894178_3930 [Bacteroidia bacterium]